MAGRVDPEVIEAKRIRQFAGYFRNYMGVSTVVVAALPVPVAYLRMIPMHEADRGSTSVITSLVCFLLLAFIFSRHRLATILFPDERSSIAWGSDSPGLWLRLQMMNTSGLRRFLLSFTILLLILAAVKLFLDYQLTWMESALHRPPSTRLSLMFQYLGFFACAEAAFVLMATKEYLQELLGLSDNDVIRGASTTKAGAGASVRRSRRSNPPAAPPAD